MKKISIVLNIVLAVAVVVLYVLHFTGKSSGTVDSETTGMAAGFNGKEKLKVVYINTDTLFNNFDKFYDLRQKLQQKQQRLEAELNTKSQEYQKDVEDFQYKVQRGLVTRSTAQEMEQQLTVQQQNLLKLRDQLTMELTEEEQVMNRQLLNDITEYLKEYNKNKGYEYIFSHSFGGSLLFAADSLNITADVIDGLNARFKAESNRK
ncbi:MAG: OmpH family outer membrane protein [Bacteroidota bacterium]